MITAATKNKSLITNYLNNQCAAQDAYNIVMKPKNILDFPLKS